MESQTRRFLKLLEGQGHGFFWGHALHLATPLATPRPLPRHAPLDSGLALGLWSMLQNE